MILEEGLCGCYEARAGVEGLYKLYELKFLYTIN